MVKKNNTNTKIEAIDLYLKGIKEICDNISQKSINDLVNLFFQAWLKQSSIIFIGNGGSAGTALHFAADVANSTVNFDNIPKLKSFSLVENICRYSALVNDRGWNNVYLEQLKNYFRPGDILVAISVHGGSGKDKAEPWSQNLTAALQYAKENGGKTVGLSGFDGGAFKDICDISIVVPYNTTPHIEAFHVVIHHLVYDLLTKKIANAAEIFQPNEK